MLVTLGTQAWHTRHGEYLFRENWFLMLNHVKATQKALAFGKQTWLAGKSYMFFFFLLGTSSNISGATFQPAM